MRFDSGHLTLSGDEIFETIQGEGFGIGYPVVFIRLQHCNLHCRWCDTKYSWGEDRTLEVITLEETVKRLSRYRSRRLVITGGEPLLQMKALEKLLDKLGDWKIEIETNGTILPSEKILARCQINMSPKLSNSGVEESIRLHHEIYKKLADRANVFFKFVVDGIEDIGEIKKLIARAEINSDSVIIMPQGINSEEIKAKMLVLLDTVIQERWRMLPRMQIYLWGEKRRV